MKKYLIFAALALLFCGCANVSAPLKTLSDPRATVTKQSPIAFAPEADIRLEKRLFYERAAEYLAKAGYTIVEPNAADYLVRVMFVPESLTTIVTEAIGGPSHMRPELTEEVRYGFHFSIYRKTDLDKMKTESIWEGSVVATQKEFRANEEEFVLGIFSHLGKSYDGRLKFPKKI